MEMTFKYELISFHFGLGSATCLMIPAHTISIQFLRFFHFQPI